MNYTGSLHCHTQYSNLRLRDCIIKEEELIDKAIELGHNLVGITDHDSVSSWVSAEEYYEKVKKTTPNFKLIRGNEIYLCRNGLNSSNYNKEIDRYYHFCLWARDLRGAQQIMEISTRAWKRSYMSYGMRRVPTYYNDLFEIIGKEPGHVIGGTACLGGALPTQILRAVNNPALLPKIGIWIQQMNKLFGAGNFFFEMQPSKNKDQIYVNKELLKYSELYNIPYIITTDAHYLSKKDRPIHKAYLNAQNGEREVDDFYATTYMMSTEELESFFKYFTKEQLDTAYKNIEIIGKKCQDFTLKKPLRIPELKWREHSKTDINLKEWISKIPMFKTFLESSHISDNYIVYSIIEGIHAHSDLQCEEAYRELNSNLEMTWQSSKVNNACWSAYFLNLQKIIDICWEAGSIIGPARGSGGGFLLLYCLDIIQMNCLREKTPMYPWRFLNPARVSPLDIDVDIEGSKRAQVLNALREFFGPDKVSNVATFGTEKSKSAILTCARGLGIDVDIAQYIASLIPSDRGQLRSLHDCFYGNEEKEFKPVKQFVIEMTNNYPELWSMAQKIEGLVCRLGEHAGGVCFVDEPFSNSTALMRASNGDLITAFELHTAEKLSLIKMDLLSVEALDKIHNCLNLLSEEGLIEQYPTLRETYEHSIGIYNLERNNPQMWQMVWEHKITSLFQLEQASGITGVAIAKPKSVEELAVLNSVIRLMAPEKGAEQPLDTWGKYRENIDIWHAEMRQYGLSEEEINWLSNHSAITDGICESQEGLMQLVQEERLGGNNLTFADSTRKAIAKKQGKLFDECEEKFFKNAEKKGCSMRLAHYVWDVLLKVQRGYSFCRAHCHAYSLIALQEMNLAYNYPIIFWNCACLINDAGGDEKEDSEDQADYVEEIYTNEIEEFNMDDSENDEDEEEEKDTTIKKKKKSSSTNYGKIATAIGKMRMNGIIVEPPDINKSTYTFSPDADLNIIRYGMSGISRVGEDLVKEIIANRPYESIIDFLSKVKVNKTQMVNLIKSGAFDSFGNRIDLMREYIYMISDTKKRVTLQNMKMLIDFKLLPPELSFHCKVYNYTKYLKKRKIDTLYYDLDDIAFTFFSNNFDIDILEPADTESGFKLSQTKWDKIYKKYMDEVRPYVKAHHDDLLNAINTRLTADMWNKYCLGPLSKWEMDSVSFYYHDHELADIDLSIYGIEDFFELSPQPEVERVIPIKGKRIPLFKLHRIAGTVLDRDKAKKTVMLLTTTGVVAVKIYGAFEAYDRQISVRGADGKKHVIEKSLFTRGNKIIVTGIRTDDSFLAKVYKATPYHRVEQITDIQGGRLVIKTERAGEE